MQKVPSHRLTAINPLDWRYAEKVNPLREYFSSHAFTKFRVRVEIEYLKALLPIIGKQLTGEQLTIIETIVTNYSIRDTLRAEEIEKETNHDVKAIEYMIKEKLVSLPDDITWFVHFALTSEDVTNLWYALMLKEAIAQVIIPELDNLILTLDGMASKLADSPKLWFTHGQTATPGTFWKTIKVFAHRLAIERSYLQWINYPWKLNWATWNLNAHVIAYPEIDWMAFSKNFVESLWLVHNPFTEQIEPHDGMARIFDSIKRLSTIMIDLNRDFWQYISLWYLKQSVRKWEIWSSTMPHKVNPINFENSEWNLRMAIALLTALSENLPISRLQRDLTDSTMSRNIWPAFWYFLLSIKSLQTWLSKISINPDKLNSDLEEAWEVITEAIQAVMKRYGISWAYEMIKNLTRWQKVTREAVEQIIEQLQIPDDAKKRLFELTPQTYIWLAPEIARMELWD